MILIPNENSSTKMGFTIGLLVAGIVIFIMISLSGQLTGKILSPWLIVAIYLLILVVGFLIPIDNTSTKMGLIIGMATGGVVISVITWVRKQIINYLNI